MKSFKETQILQCPNLKSFNDHISSLNKIKCIAKKHLLNIDWKVHQKKDLTFSLTVSGPSKTNQINGMVELFDFLLSNNIEPAIVIKMDAKPNDPIQEVLEILEA